MNKIEYALKLAKDSTYADEIMESAKQHLRTVIDEALTEVNECVDPDVMSRASFRGEVSKEQLYIILNYIDDMKSRGYFFEKHERTDLANDNVRIDYVLVLHVI